MVGGSADREERVERELSRTLMGSCRVDRQGTEGVQEVFQRVRTTRQ
jgi:hypothetical protein